MSDTKGGARHSAKDNEKINAIVAAAIELGGVCPICGNKSEKGSLRDTTDAVWFAWHSMMESAGDESLEYESWVYETYNDALIVRHISGRYIAYPFAEIEGRIMFGVPYLVEKQFVPVEAANETETIDGVVKNTPDEKAMGYEFFDNSLKVLRKTDDELVVGNYIILYGKPDLEGLGSKRKNPDGSIGEWFAKTTDINSPYVESGVIHVDWEHGRDISTPELAGQHGVLGYVDMRTAKADERGIFLERVLNRRNKYVEWLAELIDAGLVGTSSKAISGKVQRDDNGQITVWPLERDTVTVNPMQWENVGKLPDTVLNNLKALADISPEFAHECKAAGLLPGGSDQETSENRVSATLIRQVEIEGDLINLVGVV